MTNKKGQLNVPLLSFIIVFFGLLIFAPVMLKIFHSIQEPLAAQLGNISNGGEIAKENFNIVMNTASNFWDKVILVAFMLALLLMVISAFLIDSNPLWIILYIFVSFMVIIFTPNIINSLDSIYNSADFAVEVAQLTFMDYLRVHFGEFLVGIFMLTGIIIYGKLWLFPNRQGIR